jgi:SLT domain-containing protein
MEHLPAGYLADVLYQMQTESGGNPNAINLTDINAQMGTPSKGLMQVIQPTFNMWHWPGTSMNIYDPLANIAAALNYGAHGKGFGPATGQIGSGHGYAAGTMSAAPGWARVGERGPEWLRFRGGEQVLPAGTVPRGGGDVHYHVTVNVPPTVNPRDAGRQVADLLLAHTKAGGRLYPAGTVPR